MFCCFCFVVGEVCSFCGIYGRVSKCFTAECYFCSRYCIVSLEVDIYCNCSSRRLTPPHPGCHDSCSLWYFYKFLLSVSSKYYECMISSGFGTPLPEEPSCAICIGTDDMLFKCEGVGCGLRLHAHCGVYHASKGFLCLGCHDGKYSTWLSESPSLQSCLNAFFVVRIFVSPLFKAVFY